MYIAICIYTCISYLGLYIMYLYIHTSITITTHILYVHAHRESDSRSVREDI